ncbi:MAG: hypothetical protein JW754_02880 [Candidatus Aenigmarchaeota archaeon]|nr:hypothetical protein [Candidatus Aenigmarchaeota archaeon]
MSYKPKITLSKDGLDFYTECSIQGDESGVEALPPFIGDVSESLFKPRRETFSQARGNVLKAIKRYGLSEKDVEIVDGEERWKNL